MIAGPWEYHVVAGPVTRDGNPLTDKTFLAERYYKVQATCAGQTRFILVNEKRVEKEGWGWFGPYLCQFTPEKLPAFVD